MSTTKNLNEFSRLRDICYLDHVGSGLYADSQIEAIAKDLKSNLYGNPHSRSSSSKYCHDNVDQIRFEILEHFSANSDEYSVVFTSGTTEALKLTVEWFNWGDIKNCQKCVGDFVYLRDNHTSVLGLREIVVQRNVKIHCLNHEEAFEKFKRIPKCRKKSEACDTNSLFVYSAQCNFSGCKYPLKWIEKVHGGGLDEFVSDNTDNVRNSRWFCLLDAASFVSTNQLNLNQYKPDFVALSFYKMFGYPTGLGALLVKNSSIHRLNKNYYGGGTILMTLSDDRFHVKRTLFHERSEDGTINYLAVLSLRYGFAALRSLGGRMNDIATKVFRLVQYLHDRLLRLHHSNREPVTVIYRDTDYSDINVQGNIINFNIMRSNGEYVGYSEVLNVANLYNIHLRTGCFCNPGACQRHLNLTNEDLKNNFQKGHTCADNIDLIDGHPTGSIRVSFGYMSDEEDAEKLIKMIMDCYVLHPAVFKIPDKWLEESELLRKKFECFDVNDVIIREEKRAVYDNLDQDDGPSLNPPSVQDVRLDNDTIKLTKIFVYPIKSCGAYSVQSSWPVTATGLKYDREWMIITTKNVVLTQKEVPKMCLIMPHVDVDDASMILEYKGKNNSKSIKIPLHYDVLANENKNARIYQSKICSDRAEVRDWGNDVANWLESNLSIPGIRLVKLIARNKTTCDTQKNIQLSLANQAQYLLITEPSVSWFVELLSVERDHGFDDTLKRFRSNFVLSGNFPPLEEFKWNEIIIEPLRFKVNGVCNRCQMICVDQSSGEKNKTPLTTLSVALQGKIKFGMDTVCKVPHEKCGDGGTLKDV